MMIMFTDLDDVSNSTVPLIMRTVGMRNASIYFGMKTYSTFRNIHNAKLLHVITWSDELHLILALPENKQAPSSRAGGKDARTVQQIEKITRDVFKEIKEYNLIWYEASLNCAEISPESGRARSV